VVEDDEVRNERHKIHFFYLFIYSFLKKEEENQNKINKSCQLLKTQLKGIVGSCVRVWPPSLSLSLSCPFIDIDL
jgi:hypothetical protein